MSLFKHRGKEKMKIFFEITFHKVTGLEKKLNGSTIFIHWKRGSRKNLGNSKRALVSKGEAKWGDVAPIKAHLYKDPKETKKEKYDSKLLTLEIKEVSKKPSFSNLMLQDIPKSSTTKTVAKSKIDLALYAKADPKEVIKIVFKKAPGQPTLEVIKQIFLKFSIFLDIREIRTCENK
jgi:hypothetical protein